jgi:hypothetical protein
LRHAGIIRQGPAGKANKTAMLYCAPR